MKESLFSRDFALLWAGTLAFSASFQLLLTALPIYAQQLGAADSEIGLILGVFAAAAMATRLPTGWLLDQGRRVPVLALGALIFVLCSAGYLVVASVVGLLAVRLVHGTGMSAFTTTGQTLVVDVAPKTRRGEALGVYAVANTLASGLGPAAGIALMLWLGFASLFVTSVGLAAVALVVALALREPPHASARARRSPFNLAVVEPGLAMLALMFTYGAVASFVPLHALKAGLENPGLFFTAYAGAMVASQTVAGLLSDRFGRSAAILPGLGLAALGLVALSAASGWWILGAGVVYGLGVGAAQPAIYAAAGDLVSHEERGGAMGTVGLFLEMGISSGSIVAGLLAGALGTATTFLVVAVVPVFGLTMALLASRQARGRARRALPRPSRESS